MQIPFLLTLQAPGETTLVQTSTLSATWGLPAPTPRTAGAEQGPGVCVWGLAGWLVQSPEQNSAHPTVFLCRRVFSIQSGS